MANEMNRTLGVEEKSINNSVCSRKRQVNGSRTARIWQVVAPLLFVAFGLFGVNESAWAYTTTLALCGDSKSTNNVTANGIKFKLGGKYSVGGMFADYNYTGSGNTATLSWEVPAGYTINVSQIKIEARRYGSTGTGYGKYCTSKNSTLVTFCNNGKSFTTYTLDNSSYFGLGNDGTISIKAENKELDYKNIEFTYTKTANKYDVTLNANGGTGGNQTVQATYAAAMPTTLKAGGAIVAPTRTGYTFAGYYDANGKQYYSSSLTSANTWDKASATTLYAHWTANKYTVTFDLNDDNDDNKATLDFNSKEVTYASAYGTLATPSTRRFYTFDDWYTAANGGTQVTSASTVQTASNHTLHAHWTLVPEDQTLSWGEMLDDMAKGTRQPIVVSLSANSNLTTFTYESKDTSVIKIDGEYLSAVGTGTAKIVVTQPGNTYFNSVSIERTFTVWSKETPIITENGFSAEVVKDLKVGDDVTVSLTNVSDGLNGDFKAVAAKKGGVMGVARDGNTLTFTALHAGRDTITVTQTENSDIFGATKTYYFNVTRYVPEITLSRNNLVLDETATLTINNTSGHSLSFNPQGKVSYNGETGVITAVAAGTTTLTIHQDQTNSIEGKDTTFTITVSKKTPSLTVKMGGTARTSMSVARGDTATVTFETESTGEISVSPVSGAQYASYVNGVMTASVAGAAVYRVTLSETDTYESKYVDFTLNVQSSARHLPITMSSTLWNTYGFKGASSETVGWDDSNGIRIGGTNTSVFSSEAYNFSDKYVVIHFEGIPNTLSFQYAVNKDGNTGASNGKHYIEESEDGDTWTECWSGGSLSASFSNTITQELKKDTRYLRFHYTANFAGYYKGVTITEKKSVDNPVPTSVDFGTKTISSGKDSATVSINWCNIAPMTITSSNSRFTVSPSSFGNYEKYGTQEITIRFTHDEETEQAGNIVISNGVAAYNKTIPVSAKTVRRPQTITWNTEIEATGFAMNKDEQYPNNEMDAVATATSKGKVVLTSLNPDIIEVISDTALLAKTTGKVKIIAYQAGNEQYQAVRDTMEFTVTLLQKQTITWGQNLQTLLTTDKKILLTAEATSHDTITYTSADENVVRISNDTLFVVGEGSTTITAYQKGGVVGDIEYLEISKEKRVVVRNPKSQCTDQAAVIDNFDFANSTVVYDLTGVADNISFSAKHDERKNGIWEVEYASLFVDQYNYKDGSGWDWRNIYVQEVGTKGTNAVNVHIDSTATKIRFRTSETATHHITGVSVPRKKFMSSDIQSVNTNVECNATWQQTITVSHSNIDVMTISSKRGLISLSTATLSEGCGSYGDDAFTASFTSTIKNQEYKDTIVITDGKTQPSTITIPVRLYSTGLNQSIGEFVLPDTVLATNTNVAVSATASSELDVIFVSSDSTIAYVAEGKLAILKDGIVTITAKQEGNDKYDAATPKAQTVVILKAATSITTSPTAADITYGQTLSEATLSDGEGSVDGSFGWQTPGTKPTAGAHSYTVVFTPKQDNLYAAATTLVSVTVNQATPAISSWPTAGNITIAQSLGDSELEGGEADVEGTFAWKNPAENRLKPGTYERTMVFTPNDNSNYEKVEETVSITVTNVLARITTDPTAYIENNVYGFTLADVTIQGGAANVAGSFGWKDSTTIPQAGTHNYPIVFTPEDLELYSVVEVEVSLTVAKADAVLTSAPTAKELTYTGSAQTLVNSGVTTGGVMEYSLDGSDYDSELPEATEIGSYTIYYRVAADNNYNGIDAANLLATIAPKASSVTSVSSWDDVDEFTAVTVTENQHIEISSMVSVYSLTIAENTDVTVSPTGGLTVGVEGITGATTDNLKLIANADGQTGYIRISPDYAGTMPQATIEMHSKAYYDKAAGDAKWQYVGSPVVDNLKASEVFTNSYIYSWNESTGKWVNNRKNLELEPFVGYATTQKSSASGTKMTYSGQLVDGRTPVEVTLQYTAESPEAGCNVLANSFAAPIDISRIEESDFSEGVEATIYLFNTGSKADIAGRGGSVDLTAAGQYISIPVNNAATLHSENSYPIVIPAMQGFYVATNQAGTLTLDYRKLVWEADYDAHSNQPLRAQKRDNQTAGNELTGSLNITLMTPNSADHLILLESPTNVPQFENGYDAHKKMAGELNIFSVEEEDLLAVDATNTIAGTWIGVRTGDASEYTFRFNRVRNNEDWFLIDTENGSATFMEDEAEYTFFAEPNQLITNRFLIERTNSSNQPGVATGFEQASDATIRLNGNTVELSGADTWALYNIEGKIIEQGSYSGKMCIDLSRYANGVYVVRNGQKVARIMR